MTDSGRDSNPYAWWDDRSLMLKILMGIGIACLVLGAIALVFLVVMALWNALMPDIFGLKRISFLQAAGLSALCYILFQGLGGSGGVRSEGSRKRRLRRYMRDAQAACRESPDRPPEASSPSPEKHDDRR